MNALAYFVLVSLAIAAAFTPARRIGFKSALRMNIIPAPNSIPEEFPFYPPSDRIQEVGNSNHLPPFIYYEFEENEPTYLLIAKNNIRFQHLFKEMVKSRVNYVIIDIAYYTFNELIQVCEFYGYHPGTSMDVFEEPIVFLEDKEYIGGCFEMYEIIAKKN